MKKFTIGWRARMPEVFSKYLKPSIEGLRGDFNMISFKNNPISDPSDFSSAVFPAANYNHLIEYCRTPYLVLVHEDIVFTPDLLERLQETIDAYPDFGAIGLVGPDSTGTNRWSRDETIYEVDTLDSCFIMVRKDLPVRFNAEVFNELHLYVEDFCGQLHNIGRKIYTIKCNPETRIDHASETWKTLGPAWGNYDKYKQIFTKMYPNLKTT